MDDASSRDTGADVAGGGRGRGRRMDEKHEKVKTAGKAGEEAEEEERGNTVDDTEAEAEGEDEEEEEETLNFSGSWNLEPVCEHSFRDFLTKIGYGFLQRTVRNPKHSLCLISFAFFCFFLSFSFFFLIHWRCKDEIVHPKCFVTS